MSSVDLHMHSTASDGLLSPAEVVQMAHQNGVKLMALTDHDSTAGLEEAQRTADDIGIQLLPGIEISATWNKKLLHIVGLNIDPTSKPLAEGIAQLRLLRDARAEKIGQKLEKAGITGIYPIARGLAGDNMITRTHFARALVVEGHAEDIRSVFKRYLVKGKPGYVTTTWAELEDVVGWIKNAGGVAVLAHPLRYRLTSAWLRRVLEAFKSFDGDALEVVCGSHSPQENLVCAGLAWRHELKGSMGSDYHGAENPYIQIGKLAPMPDDVPVIWEQWQ